MSGAQLSTPHRVLAGLLLALSVKLWQSRRRRLVSFLSSDVTGRCAKFLTILQKQETQDGYTMSSDDPLLIDDASGGSLSANFASLSQVRAATLGGSSSLS